MSIVVRAPLLFGHSQQKTGLNPELLSLCMGVNPLLSPTWIHYLSTLKAYDASPTNRGSRIVPPSGRPAHPGIGHPGGQISEAKVANGHFDLPWPWRRQQEQ